MNDVTTIQQAAQQFVSNRPPQFGHPAQARRHRLERLAGVCRIFGHMGFSEGLLGHVTVRDPENPDQLWVNPVGVSFKRIKVSDLLKVTHQGEVLEGHRPVNPVGLRLHAAVHRARPDVTAVCHAHSLYGKAWSSLGRLLDPITQDACVLYEHQALIRDPRNVLTEEDAAQFAQALGSHRLAIQVGHGLFATGQTVDEAAWWFICMERACQAQFLAESIGQPEHWRAPDARALASALGSPDFGWLSFQTLWDEVVRSDPDLFD